LGEKDSNANNNSSLSKECKILLTAILS